MRMVLCRVIYLCIVSAVLYVLLQTAIGFMGENMDDRVAMGIAVWAGLFLMVLMP